MPTRGDILAKLLVKISADTAAFGPALKNASKDLKSFSDSAKGINDILKTFGVGFGIYEVSQQIRQAIGILSDFEKTMSEVKAITGATGREFESLEKDARRLGASTKFTATQVGQLQVAYGRLGFTTKEILQATEATLDLATATGEDLAKSADVAGSTVRGFGLEASETQRVVDVMAASFNKTALGLENFTESMKYVAPVAAAAGLSVEETTALLGTLADAGIRGSMAGTSLRKILTDLPKDSRPFQERLDELSKRGITLADSMDEVGRTAQTSLLILTKNNDKTKQLAESFKNVEGEAAKMARTMGDNLAGDLDRLSSAYEGAMLKLSNTSALRGATRALTIFINKLADVNDVDTELTALAAQLEYFGEISEDAANHYIKTITKVRQESGKPIDLRVITELTNRYHLTDKQANFLYETLLKVNSSLSFQEQVLVDLEKLKVDKRYESISTAAQAWTDTLNDQIVTLTNSVQHQKQLAIESGVSKETTEAQIKPQQDLIDKYLHTIDVLRDYIKEKKNETDATVGQIVSTNGLIQTLEDQIKSLEERRKAAFSIDDVVKFNEQIEKLRVQLALLNEIPSAKALEQFRNAETPRGKALSNLSDRPSLTGDDFLKSTGTSVQATKDAVQTASDAISGLKVKYSEDIDGMILANQRLEEQMMRTADIAVASADIIGDALGGIASGSESGISALRKATIAIIDLFYKQALAAAIAKAVQTKGPLPIGLIAAGVGIAAVKAMFSRAVGRTGSGGGGGSSVSNGREVNSTASNGTVQDSSPTLTSIIRGEDLYVIWTNYNRNNGFTRTQNG